MKQRYYNKFVWLNIYFLSIFWVLLFSQEVRGESKEPIFNKNYNQLSFERVVSSSQIASTSAKDLLEAGGRSQNLAQNSQQALTRVTGVEVKQTPKGLELILQTVAGSQKLVPLILPEGNNLVIDLLDATLALPSGNQFRETAPAPGIKEINLIKIDESSIRLTITGETQAPSAEVIPSQQNLILSINPQGTTAQTKPEREIVVTATRTEEEVTDVPRSVTVVDRNQIEQQSQISRNLGDILSNTVPGFSAPTNRTNTFGQSLRGRGISVLIDGIPQNTNLQSIPAWLTTIDPNAIERIEVVRGPNAVYGGQATGGTINIITRASSQKPLASTTTLGISNSLIELDDSFGYLLQHDISGTEGKYDYAAGFSLETVGSYYDAEGDRVLEGEYDSNNINALLKFGVDFTEKQRLQLTFNYFDQQQESDFTADPAIFEIPGTQKARAIEVPEGTRVIGAPDNAYNRTLNTTASYSNQDIFGSQLDAQLYYRNNSFSGNLLPFDDRVFGGEFIATTPGESEELGTRLQINTPFNKAKTISLLWGVDYIRENSSQDYVIFDTEEFDASGGLIFRKIDELSFVPPYKVNDLGLFAQLQWNVTDSLQFSGGLRYINLGVNVEDYTTIDGQEIQGGDRNYNTTAFNVGTVYNFTNEIGVFANFAQGFSVPNFGSIFREPPTNLVRVTDTIENLEPQKVDNYELGIRGEWQSIQASLSGFYNYSELGESPVLNQDDLISVRAPQKIYGVEATLDVQPLNSWNLGTTVSWQEGENDEDNDDEYLALSSIAIAPFKITAYIENQTLPGWINRLQLLYSGSRDRAFEDGIDGAEIDDYVTVDYLSSLKLGKGNLEIGVENLLNNQYYTVFSQSSRPFDDSFAFAARGRTLSVNYRIDW
jgi:iron complex outermembrane recepter protein